MNKDFERTLKNLGSPVFQLVIDEEGKYTYKEMGIVKTPAISEDFVYYSGITSQVNFSIQDEEKRIIVGPAMIPYLPILRRTEENIEYFTFYDEKTIENVASTILRNGELNKFNINHNHSDRVNASLKELWFVADPVKDKSSLLGFDLPVNTLMLSANIIDDNTWQLVKEKKIKGFSIEARGKFYPVEFSNEDNSELIFNSIAELLKEYQTK